MSRETVSPRTACVWHGRPTASEDSGAQSSFPGFGPLVKDLYGSEGPGGRHLLPPWPGTKAGQVL